MDPSTQENDPFPPGYELEIKATDLPDESVYSVRSNAIYPTNDLGLVLPNVFPADYILRYSQLPKPAIGRLGGWSPAATFKASIINCASAASQVKRPLTAEECDAISFLACKASSIQFYGLPIAVIAASTRCYATRSSMKFPMYKPKPGAINPNNFLGVRGPLAKFAWHQLRWAAYFIFSLPITSLLLGSYAVTTYAVGFRKDSRLKALDEVRQNRNTPRPIIISSPQGQQTQPSSYPSHPTQPVNPQYPQQPEYSRQPPPPPPPQSRWDDASPQAQPLDFGFDDASPAAADSADGTGPGSAWDRIRKGRSVPSRPSPSPSAQSPTNAAANADPDEDAWARTRQADVLGGQEEQRRAREREQRELEQRELNARLEAENKRW